MSDGEGDAGLDQAKTWTMEVHSQELAGALESWRGETIPGKIVGAKQPSDRLGYVELTWVSNEDFDNDNDTYECEPCRHMVPSRNGRIVVPGGASGTVWCPWCGDAMELIDDE